MEVTFRTSEFVAAHGKSPRGKGWWWFEANGRQYCLSGSYSDAKARLKELIEQDNPNEIVVTAKVLS